VRSYIDWLGAAVAHGDARQLIANAAGASTGPLRPAQGEGAPDQYLSVLKLTGKNKAPIQASWVRRAGKTSLGRSIARALGRRFVRVARAVCATAEIRGHAHYIGSMPGRVIRPAPRGSRNPVFLLDEIDKLGALARNSGAARGPGPEQNHTFNDPPRWTSTCRR
jgi:hypothetical protein